MFRVWERAMTVLKTKALKLLSEKIEQFKKVLQNATYENQYKDDYKRVYYGTEALIKQLFSEEEAMEFRRNVTEMIVSTGRIDHEKELNDYKNHINSCISQLDVYVESISNFWENDKTEMVKKVIAKPFICMSFQENDKEINNYVIGILKALEIDFDTGERYSKDSIPQKVKSRIRNSGLFIAILVNRDKIEGGGYTTPAWLLKELGIAQGCNKDVIAWVEKDIKDIAGLNYEKEVIYFDRSKVDSIENATLKFLEALKEHNLI